MCPEDLYSACLEPENLPPAVHREPVVAGQFYPANPGRLEEKLEKHFANAMDHRLNDLRALIVPHAGYVFSGDVAAEAYAQIDTEKEYDNIFILASSHRCGFGGASIYNPGDYETPLGRVKVNRRLATKLINEHDVFAYRPEAHSREHSLEVQLPFLRHRLGKKIQIVPIVLGTQEAGTCQRIADALKSYFTPNNLFIISSDFSHYPPYEQARKNDESTARAIAMNDPQEFLEYLHARPNKPVPGLATSACGWTSILTLLYLSESLDKSTYHLLKYENSGDKEFGQKDEVVGYYAIALAGASEGEKKIKGERFSFSQQEKDVLLMIARHSIQVYLDEKKLWQVEEESVSPALLGNYGAFVSIKIGSKLRGCIGRFSSDMPLYRLVQKMAISAATQDPRFRPLTLRELREAEIEVSVLSPMRKISSIDEIIPGLHGIYIKKGFASGTLLPQVARETGWSTEEFLGHCARDKAGLSWDGWKEAEIFTYEALVIKE